MDEQKTIIKHNFDLDELSNSSQELSVTVEFSKDELTTVSDVISSLVYKYYQKTWSWEERELKEKINVYEVKKNNELNKYIPVEIDSIAKPGAFYKIEAKPDTTKSITVDKIGTIKGSAEFRYKISLAVSDQLELSDLRYEKTLFSYNISIIQNNNLTNMYKYFLSNIIKNIYKLTGSRIRISEIYEDFKFLKGNTGDSTLIVNNDEFKSNLSYTEGEFKSNLKYKVIQSEEFRFKLKALSNEKDIFKIKTKNDKYEHASDFKNEILDVLNSTFKQYGDDKELFPKNFDNQILYRVDKNGNKELIDASETKNIDLSNKDYKYFVSIKYLTIILNIFTDYFGDPELIIPIFGGIN